jgi:hypothetical protein
LFSSSVDTLFLLLPNPLPVGRCATLLMLPAHEAWRISCEALFTRVRERIILTGETMQPAHVSL